jgi:DNA-directed RNA polymerase subunit beta
MSKESLMLKRIRKNFGRIPKVIDIPDLIGIQKKSFSGFIQKNIQPGKRRDTGLQSAFKSVFPIKDFTGSTSLEFVSYKIEDPIYTVEECEYRGMTYEASIRIIVRLLVFDIDSESGASNIRDIKEQEIYFGSIPLMTDNGTFVINGVERTIVNQLHRSSGVFFSHDKGKLHSIGKVIYNSRVIPVRGSWIDMEIDSKDIIHIKIDKRRKFPATLLLKSFGYSTDNIVKYFYKTEKILASDSLYFKYFNEDLLKGQRSVEDIINPETEEVILKKGRLFSRKALKNIKEAGITKVYVNEEYLFERYFATTIYDKETTNPIVKSCEKVNQDAILKLAEFGISEFDVIFNEEINSDSIRKTLNLDKIDNRSDALIEIYRRLRPGNPVTPEIALDFIDNIFFRSSYYDLSGVGRLKINHRLGIDVPLAVTTLRKEDILLVMKTLITLKDTQGNIDDIDHLGNRRVRTVGELLENQYRIGLVRMERAIKEKMSLQEVEAMMPHDFVNPKPVTAVMREFFGTSQLSQFLDQTNPLSETTHKRRLSALGPGGLTRERAGFEVRDVHPSHYGRICPIETPEGPNIGLIVSLGSYAQVNDFGFIETPCLKVDDSIVSEEVRYLSAFEEKNYPIAQANAPMDKDRKYINSMVNCRVQGEYMMVRREDVKFMDISPNQMVSVSASLIPFLENDDANRALMGSNMQRQAVPLLNPSAPLVGTGVEAVVARDSGVSILTKYNGRVLTVDANRIVIINDDPSDEEITIYNMFKFSRTNQNTCFNNRPIVAKGQFVKAGEVIADGPATDRGELALGRNIIVAFMPWSGYNFEDSILLSENLVKDDIFTSVHIEEFEVIARETKLGKEEITRDIPNIGEDILKNLDECGIIKLGSHVTPGDVLVGKITPKGETTLTPEEKLLRAIFGEKAGEVKDTSLRVPPGVAGTVIDVKIFSRRGFEKDQRAKEIDAAESVTLKRNRDDELKAIEFLTKERIWKILEDIKLNSDLMNGKKVVVSKGETISFDVLSNISVSVLKNLNIDDNSIIKKIQNIIDTYEKGRKLCNNKYKEKIEKYKEGYELQPGIIKMIKVYVAMKRKLSVGDKMAGRHGNKGVVSRIVPQEDLPYFEDGTPVDMVLNPLGVPSRMNVGQILEIHLGSAAKGMGDLFKKLAEEKRLDDIREKINKLFSDEEEKEKINSLDDKDFCEYLKVYDEGVPLATPVFDGANEDEIKELLQEAGISETGQFTLYDGTTGEKFDRKVTVGIMYMLKLHHLVDDKIHARSIGPYSLITQQPLGGKAQFGGQRLGEMEVWAMEAYGSAYALQEFLTVKSDDMAGRTRMYEKIVKGRNVLEPGIPESFNVLTKELKGLGLDIELIKKEQI